MDRTKDTKYAFFNGKIVNIDDAHVSIRTAALHYGVGIFEGIRSYWNEEKQIGYLFRVKEHYDRMRLNAKIIAMDIPYTTEELTKYSIELLLKEDFGCDTYVRPLAYYKSESILEKLHSTDYGFSIFTFPMEAILDINQGLNVCVSSWSRVNDNMIAARGKICGSYVNICLVNYEAKQNGYDDGILLTQNGHVSEGGGQNIAIIRNGKLIVPAVSDDILEGITLDSIMTLMKDELRIEVERRAIDRTELYQSEEVFYCGTGCQIAPIISVDRRKIGDGKPGLITKRLQELFFEIVRGNNAKYMKWCTPVE